MDNTARVLVDYAIPPRRLPYTLEAETDNN
jgi:hypothetical protein